MINVLSLFNGISCGRVALDGLGIKVGKYYSSEIDKNAIIVADANHPNDIPYKLGDINNWEDWDVDWENINLILAGSPCQGFSRNGGGLNFEHPKSKLFFVFDKIVNHIKKFNPNVIILLENVNMAKEWQDVITSYMGVDPIQINSGLVSPHERLRTYWTNIIGVKQPKDKKIMLVDILEDKIPNECYDLDIHEIGMIMYTRNGMLVRNGTKWKGYLRAQNGDGIDMAFAKTVKSERRGRRHKGKIGTLDTSCKWYVYVNDRLRKFTRTELERLQGLPDGYTSMISDNQAKKVIGNGWQVDTIKHILSYLETKR